MSLVHRPLRQTRCLSIQMANLALAIERSCSGWSVERTCHASSHFLVCSSRYTFTHRTVTQFYFS